MQKPSGGQGPTSFLLERRRRKALNESIAYFGQSAGTGTKLVDLAKPELSELRLLSIGQARPGHGRQRPRGPAHELSDYRASCRVVVGPCGGCAEVAKLREIQNQLGAKSFAIIGMYAMIHPEDATSLAKQSGMTWPSFSMPATVRLPTRMERDLPSISGSRSLKGYPLSSLNEDESAKPVRKLCCVSSLRSLCLVLFSPE